MSTVDEMMRELKAERPRRYFDQECRRLTNMRGKEFIDLYNKDGLRYSGISEKTLYTLIDLMIWLRLR